MINMATWSELSGDLVEAVGDLVEAVGDLVEVLGRPKILLHMNLNILVQQRQNINILVHLDQKCHYI